MAREVLTLIVRVLPRTAPPPRPARRPARPGGGRLPAGPAARLHPAPPPRQGQLLLPGARRAGNNGVRWAEAARCAERLRRPALVSTPACTRLSLAVTSRSRHTPSPPDSVVHLHTPLPLSGGSPAGFHHLVYPLPEPGTAGLGTHLTLDLAGGVRFGPDVEW